MNPPVEPGQIWASKDERDMVLVVVPLKRPAPYSGGTTEKRYERRTFRIARIVGQKAVVVNTVTGRSTGISLRRLKYSLGSRGYELVTDIDREGVDGDGI
jgi:hypothetical protein